MKTIKPLWRNEKWYEFSARVKKRDGYRCLNYDRTSNKVILQVHHEIYIPNKAPWDYSLSDCRTLCKGCHAKEHGLIEPDKEWSLISIDDLGDITGICERNNCGKNIRYEHLTYHPSWGYKKVGSTCIEHLTQKDKSLSKNVLKLYKSISLFVHKPDWSIKYSKKGTKYLQKKYSNHLISIYGKNGYYSFQLAIYDYKSFVQTKGKGLEEVKELSYIALKGTISNSYEEKSILRNLYKSIK